jgi:hypothetical protein
MASAEGGMCRLSAGSSATAAKPAVAHLPDHRYTLWGYDIPPWKTRDHGNQPKM